jgi:uncharacterized protein YceH (UPF0502 family)
VEKQLTTPQQYPLTLNALTAAANQATNRDPVVTLDDDTVVAALDELRSEHLIRVVLPSHGRSVKRYRHVLDEVYGLDAPRYGLLGVLLLRGPQTVGELRARSERMVDFPSIGDVQDQLNVLAEHSEGLARLLPRRSGQKEDRWQQIMAAPWGSDVGSAERDEAGGDRSGHVQRSQAEPGSSVERASAPDVDLRSELEVVRSELDSLRTEVAALRQELDALRQGLGG